jgi:hypothetical protein
MVVRLVTTTEPGPSCLALCCNAGGVNLVSHCWLLLELVVGLLVDTPGLGPSCLVLCCEVQRKSQ